MPLHLILSALFLTFTFAGCILLLIVASKFKNSNNLEYFTLNPIALIRLSKRSNSPSPKGSQMHATGLVFVYFGLAANTVKSLISLLS